MKEKKREKKKEKERYFVAKETGEQKRMSAGQVRAKTIPRCCTNNRDRLFEHRSAVCLICREVFSADELARGNVVYFFSAFDNTLICRKRFSSGEERGCFMDLMCVCDNTEHHAVEYQEINRIQSLLEPTKFSTALEPFRYRGCLWHSVRTVTSPVSILSVYHHGSLRSFSSRNLCTVSVALV